MSQLSTEANLLDYYIIVREFELQLRYHVHFRSFIRMAFVLEVWYTFKQKKKKHTKSYQLSDGWPLI